MRVFTALLAVMVAGASVSADPPAYRPYAHKVALCIGINEWDGPGASALQLGDLGFAESDAKAVGAALADKATYAFEVRTLLGKEATREAVLSALRAVLTDKGVGPDDVVVVFYAGHGVRLVTDEGSDTEQRQGYITPCRIEKAPGRSHREYADQLVSMGDVADMAKNSRARHVLLLMDCCFSGFAAASRAGGAADAGEYAQLMSRYSRIAITAGTDEERSFEWKDRKHGYFTQAVLDTLAKRRAAGDPFSAGEFFFDLRGEVRDATTADNVKQSPQMRPLRQEDGEYIWLPGGESEDRLAKGAKKKSKAPPPSKAEEVKSRGGEVTKRREKIKAAKPEASDDDLDKACREDPELKAVYSEYSERAAMGDPYAMQLVAVMESQGLGTTKNPAAAFRAAQEASAAPDPAAQADARALLSNFFQVGVGTRADPAAAGRVRQKIPAGHQAIFGLLSEMAGTGQSGQKPNPADLMSAMFGGAAGRPDNAVPATANGASGGGGLVPLLRMATFSQAEVRTIAEAMADVEAKGTALRAAYEKMVSADNYSDDNLTTLSEEWKAAALKIDRFSKGTAQEAAIASAREKLSESLKALRVACKAGKKVARVSAIEAAEAACRDLRKAVGTSEPGR